MWAENLGLAGRQLLLCFCFFAWSVCFCIAYFPELTIALNYPVSRRKHEDTQKIPKQNPGSSCSLTSTEPFKFFFTLSWPLHSFANSSAVGYGTWAGSWFGNDEASEALLSARLLNLITELMHTAREKNIHQGPTERADKTADSCTTASAPSLRA